MFENFSFAITDPLFLSQGRVKSAPSWAMWSAGLGIPTRGDGDVKIVARLKGQS